MALVRPLALPGLSRHLQNQDAGAHDLHRPSRSRILCLSLVYFCLTPLPGACGPELVSLTGPDPGSSGGECQANEAKVTGQLVSGS